MIREKEEMSYVPNDVAIKIEKTASLLEKRKKRKRYSISIAEST